MLEDALKKEIFSIKEMKDLVSIKYTFLEEMKQVIVAESSTNSGTTKIAGFTMNCESAQSTIFKVKICIYFLFKY